jgi:ribulose-phosphate 3-epimerase
LVLVAPSVLAADFSKLGKELSLIEKAKPDFIHFDVMDGHYVPNLTFGPPVMKALFGKTSVPFEAHLMVSNPEALLKEYVAAGAKRIIFHPETVKMPFRTIKKIKLLGAKPGICINNKVDVRRAFRFLKHVDLVLIMSVEAGFGGQVFNNLALKKIRVLKEECVRQNVFPLIAVDGGINEKTGKLAVDAGANLLVVGSAVFGSKNPVKAINFLKKL